MCMIISIVFGTFMSGVIDQLTGSLRSSIFIFAGLFILGAYLLRGVKNETSKVINFFDGMNLDSYKCIQLIYWLTDILTFYEQNF